MLVPNSSPLRFPLYDTRIGSSSYTADQIVLGLQIRDLTKKQFTLLMMFISFYKTYNVVYFGQGKQAERARCCRMTVHRAMKKFQELGFIEIVSGLDPSNDTHNATNIYLPTESFKAFLEKTDVKGLLKYLKYREKVPVHKSYQNSHFQRGNVTPHVTQINTNNNSCYPEYKYSNVERSKDQFISFQLQDQPLSYKDKVYFSRYNESVLSQALETAKYVEARTPLYNGLGAFLNKTCRKIANRLL